MIRAVQCHEFSAVQLAKDDRGRNSDNPSPPTSASVHRRHTPKRLGDVLRLDWIPKPRLTGKNGKEPSVLIQVYYAGIQYPDALQAQGLYQVRPPLPYVPGMDVTGVVVAADTDTDTKQVDTLTVGTRVLATLLDHGGTGGMAELVRVPVAHVYVLPDAVPMKAAANVGRNYFAAYHSLVTVGGIPIPNKSKSNINEQAAKPPLVLVDGASGGVGMATVELAKALGCRVIAGVSDKTKSPYPASVGADEVLCYGRDKTSYKKFKIAVRQAAAKLGDPQGVDLVVDMVQGDLFESALVPCVRPLGTVALVGFAAGQRPIRPGLLLIKEVNVVGSLWGRWALQYPDQHRQNVHHILQLFATGGIAARVDREFGIEEFDQAFALFENNQGRGNTVVCWKPESANDRDAATTNDQPTTPSVRSRL